MSSGSSLLDKGASIELNESLSPSTLLGQVVDDFLGSVIVVLKDSFFIVMAHEDQWDLVDDDNVFSVDHEIVDGITSLLSWPDDFSWEHPLAIIHDWVTWCDLESILE